MPIDLVAQVHPDLLHRQGRSIQEWVRAKKMKAGRGRESQEITLTERQVLCAVKARKALQRSSLAVCANNDSTTNNRLPDSLL